MKQRVSGAPPAHENGPMMSAGGGQSIEVAAPPETAGPWEGPRAEPQLPAAPARGWDWLGDVSSPQPVPAEQPADGPMPGNGAGQASIPLPIPNNVVGATLYHQWVQAQISPTVLLTVSNGRRLTVQ